MVAFLDHRPVFKGHVLVAPVRHVDTLLDLPVELMTPLLTRPSGWPARSSTRWALRARFVAVNNVVSQSVPHLHVHVVPRTKGDGLRGFFWPRTSYARERWRRTRSSSPTRCTELSGSIQRHVDTSPCHPETARPR